MTILNTLRNRWTIVIAALLALVLSGAVVAVVGDSGDDSTDAASKDEGSAGAPLRLDARATTGAVAVESDALVGGGGAAAPTPARGGATAAQTSDAVVPGQPRVVKNATIRVEVARKSFLRMFDRAASVAAAHGGFVLSSTSATDDETGARGELVLRVRADQFDAARRDLARLGDVEEEQISGEDVSGQLVDLDARIRSLQVQEEALRTLLARGDTVGEILEVQQQLTMTRTQIEQLAAQRAQLADAAALATINLSLFEPGVAPAHEDEPSTGLAYSFDRAVDGAVAVVGGMVVVLGYTLPLAALGLLGWIGFRMRRRVAAA
jgi:uncharacterized protein DUF4349